MRSRTLAGFSSGAAGIGALILGPEPNEFTTTALRDTTGTTPTHTIGANIGGAWRLIGGRPTAAGQVQFNESLREMAITLRDTGNIDRSALIGTDASSPLIGKSFRLRISATNFADFSVVRVTGTGGSGASAYVIFDIHDISVTGSLTVNSFTNLRPRTTVGGPNWLAEYDANEERYAVKVTTPDPEEWYTRVDGEWVEASGLVEGEKGDEGDPGSGASAADIDARIATWARANNPTGQIPDARIPAEIMRDAELTAAAIRGLLGLTADEVNNLLTGAVRSGQTLTFPQNDGTMVTITLPQGTGGADGVVSSGEFSADGQTLTLTLDSGGTIEISVPAALRGAGGSNVKGDWVAETTYDRGDIAIHSSTLWIQYGAATRQSAATPPADPLHWFRLGRVQDRESGASYRIGDMAVGSDDRLYVCIKDGANIATDPVDNPDEWFLFNPVRQGLAYNTTRTYLRGDSVFESGELHLCKAATSTGTNPTTEGQTDWVQVGGGGDMSGNADASLLRGSVQPQTVKRTATTDVAVAAPNADRISAGVGTTITLDELEDGSILSSLDSAEESVVIAPGVYIAEVNFHGFKNAVTSSRSSVGFVVQQKEADDTWTTIATSAPIYVRGVAAVTDELEFLRPEVRFGLTESKTIRFQALSLPFWGIPAVPPIAWSFQEAEINLYAIGGIEGPAGSGGSARGALIARTTGAFPGGSVSFGGTISGVTWEAATDPAPGNSVFITGLNLTLVHNDSPSIPEGAFGIMFVPETVVGDVVTEIGVPVVVPFTAYSSDNNDTRKIMLLSATQRLVIANQLRDAATDGYGHLIRGGNTNFPAGLRVSAYWAQAVGPKGEKGDPKNVPDAPEATAFDKQYHLHVPTTGDPEWRLTDAENLVIPTLRGGFIGATPGVQAADLTIVGSEGELEFAAFTGEQLVVAQLDSEDDITEIYLSDAPTADIMDGFTKQTGTVTVVEDGENVDYASWVGNLSLTKADGVSVRAKI